eukprot:47829-Chlamydomonas_euryale.AAC.3
MFTGCTSRSSPRLGCYRENKQQAHRSGPSPYKDALAEPTPAPHQPHTRHTPAPAPTSTLIQAESTNARPADQELTPPLPTFCTVAAPPTCDQCKCRGLSHLLRTFRTIHARDDAQPGPSTPRTTHTCAHTARIPAGRAPLPDAARGQHHDGGGHA